MSKSAKRKSKTELAAPDAKLAKPDDYDATNADADEGDFVFYIQQRDEYGYYSQIGDFKCFVSDMTTQITEQTRDIKAHVADPDLHKHCRHVAHHEMQTKHLVNYDALTGAMNDRFISQRTVDECKVGVFLEKARALFKMLYPKKSTDEDMHVSWQQAKFIATLLK